MLPNDKIIWDTANDEEFDGLASLPTRQVITEDQFKQLSKGVKALLPWPLLLLSIMHTIVRSVQSIELWYWAIWTTIIGLKNLLQLL
jgi:hypothetical protein